VTSSPVLAGSLTQAQVDFYQAEGYLFNDPLIHMSTANNSDHVRWSVDLRYQPTDQDPMTHKGIGFLARSCQHPERVTTLEDWLAERPEHSES
jgi:phytanoyl-CoA hydroxylase